jgi:asparagine synthase (glutamine-hydrolysing)
MCGIAGFVGGYVAGLVNRMNALQRHRGPDGEGVFQDAAEEVALGHVRLAILDLTDLAAQPMDSQDGRYVLVFNGEIYNFQELRTELAGLGHSFRSCGDTEVLLHGLQQFGPSYVKRLNGIFAFALWDRRKRELLLARDHLGVKPLYYTAAAPGTLLFASELKALCAYPGLPREPDFEVLQQHLAYCHASDERTAMKGISRLPPGAILSWSATTRQYSIQTYWRPDFHTAKSPDRGRAVEELRETIRDATRRQMVSDVPVGSFLSGGLDSSLITALAARKFGPAFEGYTITYPTSDNILDCFDDDAPHARNVAGQLGLKLREIEIRPDVTSLWPRLVYQLDEPLADPAAISCYLVCRLARDQGTKVLLSGQGADELFGGYPRYQLTAAMAPVNWTPRIVRSFVARSAALLPGAWQGQFGSGLRRVRRAAIALGDDADGRFLNYCASTPQAEISRVLTPQVRRELHGKSFKTTCVRHMKSRGLAGLDRFQERDLAIYLPNHNLLYTDKIGMAVGLEVRVPLLDLELVGKVLTYPPAWRLSRLTTKALLRDAARGILPDSIIDRRKAGFGAPYRKWLRYDLAEMWNDLMSEVSIRRRGWFDQAAVQAARTRSQAGSVDLYMLQWVLLTVELWARQFIDRCPGS